MHKTVLFIAYHLPPIGGGGVQRTTKFLKFLKEYNYKAVVLTCPGPEDYKWTPSDLTLVKSIPMDVKVYRVEQKAPPPSSKLKQRLQRVLFLPDNFTKWWIKHASNLGDTILKNEKVDIIYATMSPFQSASVARYLSNKYKLPWVADLRDPWALDETQKYFSRLHRIKEKKAMEKYLLDSDAIIANTPEAKRIISREIGSIKKNKMTVITNGYDSDDFAEIRRCKKSTKFKIVHVGNMHTDAGLEKRGRNCISRLLGGEYSGVNILSRSHYYLIKALAHLREECPNIHKNIEFVQIGNYTTLELNMVKGVLKNGNYEFTGHLNHDDALLKMCSADLLFLPMHNMPAGQRTTIVPGKFYEYMASGKHILAAAPEGDLKDFTLKAEAGDVVEPEDYVAMEGVIKVHYENWKIGIDRSSNCNDYMKRFERRNLTKKLVKVFDVVLSYKR